MTVSRFTLTKRLVLRTPQPSPIWPSTATTLASGNRAWKSGVPLRSAKRAWQVRQYSNRSRLSLP
jgi:hypothetical protein